MCVSVFGLTSCQNEMDNLGGKEVTLRVTANRGEAATRTTLAPDGEGNLACTWDNGDQLLVVKHSDGSKLGVITLVSGADSDEGVFEGKVNLDGHDAVSLVYLGKAGNAETYADNNLALNVSAQDGTLASLTSKDVLAAEAAINDGDYVNPNLVETRVEMRRQLAHGYFELNFGDGVELKVGDEITITGEGLRSEGKVNFKRGGTVPTITNYTGSTTITVTKKEAGNDFYLTMLPVGNVTPTFTVEKDGVTYTAELGAHKWVSGEFVRGATNSTNETGFDPVSVSMEEVATIDHSVNPLLKWAKGDLVRSGSGKNVTGTVSDDPWISGSYYQFGRNYGYNTASEVIQLATEMTLTGGTCTFRGKKYTAGPVNGIYNASNGKVLENENVTTPNYISDYPQMFFMNGGDYVSPGYTETWEKRAKVTNGYTYETPCPAEWRIPTRADFEEILPVNNGQVGSTSWNTVTQVKLIGKDKVPCAFRWSKENNALKIECLVLSSKDDTPDWSSQKVEVRYFKLSGCLTSFMQSGQMEDNGYYSVQYVADVLNFGEYDTQRTLGTTSGLNKIYYMKVYRLSDYMSDTGFYWTSDADQQVFTLNANSRITSYPHVGYYFTKSSVTIGANIRCIRK